MLGRLRNWFGIGPRMVWFPGVVETEEHFALVPSRWECEIRSGRLDREGVFAMGEGSDPSWVHTMLPAQWLASYAVGFEMLSCRGVFVREARPRGPAGIAFENAIPLLEEFGVVDSVSFSRNSVRHGKFSGANTHHSQRSVLHHAIGYDRRGGLAMSSIEALLAAGADPNSADAFGVVPLMLCVFLEPADGLAIWDLLCSRGADAEAGCRVIPSMMGGLASVAARYLGDSEVSDEPVVCSPREYVDAVGPGSMLSLRNGALRECLEISGQSAARSDRPEGAVAGARL